jgi:hypothetical protein
MMIVASCNRTLLVRWSGASPLGHPVSYGHPTWFVLPKNLHAAVLSVVKGQNQQNQSSACEWLDGKEPTAWEDV